MGSKKTSSGGEIKIWRQKPNVGEKVLGAPAVGHVRKSKTIGRETKT
jgi:hypothetical protein